MTADANVLLKISSDAGNAITGISSLVGMMSQVIGKIKEFALANDQFVRAMNRATIDISEADSATGGLIDTTALYTQQVKLQQAEVELTSNQYRAFAVAAAEMGKITGDTTGEFKKLTEGLAKGAGRSFKALGIDIENTEDHLLAQAEIVEKITEKYGDASVEVESLSEGMYVLGNNVDTTTALLWKAASGATGLGTALNGLNDQLGIANAYMTDWPEMVFNADTAIGNFIGTFKDFATSDWVWNFAKYVLPPLGLTIDAVEWLFDTDFQDVTESALDELQDKFLIEGRESALKERSKKRAAQEQKKARESRAAQGDLAADAMNDFWNKQLTQKERKGGKGRKKDKEDQFDLDSFIDKESRYEDFGGDQNILGTVADPFEMQNEMEMINAQEDFDAQIARNKQSRDEFKEWTEWREEQKKAEHDALVERWNMNENMTESWGDAWISMIDEVDYKMNIMNTTWSASENITRSLVTSIAMGEKMTVRSVANMVRGVALQIGIEAQVQMLMNTAKAIAEGVSSWGAFPRIEGFVAAAAAFQATAAVAFAVAAGSKAIAGSAARKGAKSTPGNSSRRDYSNSMAGRSTEGQTNVNVTLQGDADGLFRVVAEKNEEKKRAGEAGIAA